MKNKGKWEYKSEEQKSMMESLEMFYIMLKSYQIFS